MYLGLAVLSFVIMAVGFGTWFAAYGFAWGRMFSEMFANPLSSLIRLDAGLAGVTAILLAIRGIRRGVPAVWLAILGTLVVGVSFGLPLYAYLEERRRVG